MREKTKSEVITELLDMAEKVGVIETNYRGFFALRFYKINPKLIPKLVEQAIRKGVNRKRYFTFLVKQEAGF